MTISLAGTLEPLAVGADTIPSIPGPVRVGVVVGCALLFVGLVGRARGQLPQRVISTSTSRAWSVRAADLDGDGDADVLSASQGDDTVAWFEKLADGTFSDRKVITTNADRASSVIAVDLDGDTDLDVLSASQADDKVAWYENLGDGQFSGQNVISTAADAAVQVHAADLDGDGDADVLSASIGDDKIAWYENLDDGGFSGQNVISTDVPDALSVASADVDGDGDADVLSAARGDNKIAWHENLDDGGFSELKVISTQAADAQSVFAGDLDGDGDPDVLSASFADDKIAWYANRATQDTVGFSEQKVLTTNAVEARSVYAVDLGDDGDLDVLSASSGDDKIAWYKNVGDGEFQEQSVITTSANFAASVFAADLDGDGDPDVLSASYEDDKIAWYENTEGVLPVEVANFEARVDGKEVVLEWTTTSETGNSGFEVEHLAAGHTSWNRLGFVESRASGGTSTRRLRYRYRANVEKTGRHSFRLEQVDLDGSSTLIDPVWIEVPLRTALQLVPPRPNPASRRTTISFAVRQEVPTTVVLYTMLGQRVTPLYKGTPAPDDTKVLNIDTGGLASGTYLVRVRAGGRVETERLTVIR